jgi:hypothetical protein
MFIVISSKFRADKVYLVTERFIFTNSVPPFQFLNEYFIIFLIYSN